MKIGFGEMSTVLLDGQRAVPQKLQQLGFVFKYDTAQAALRNLLGGNGASSVTASTNKEPDKVGA
jgi:NAD dependent epimerase/dehydratase family enzyme